MNSGAPASGEAWVFLITTLPGRNQTLRMRLWRALKAAGAGLLKDGVYVLPASDTARNLFDEQAAEIEEAGGTGYVLSMTAQSTRQTDLLRALFDRTEDYAGLLARLLELKRAFAKFTQAEARQQLAAMKRDAAALIVRDFFPGTAKQQMEDTLQEVEAALDAHFSPDEPRPAHRPLRRRERADYQGRTWATRERPWVDRVACAWLIRRNIDSQAQFLWLKQPRDCPPTAVGFDFDGAEFTHIGNKVTFEVLVSSFGLGADPGLMQLGALVHHLDVGGIPVAEAAGFATILAGTLATQSDDDALLERMLPVLDSLYAAFRLKRGQSSS